MSKKANPTVVGSFVVGAIALSIIGVIVLGGGRFFEEKFDFIAYFDESISGLDVGAPVDFQGVRIGTVTGVRLEFDRKNRGEILRPVTLQILGGRINFVQERDQSAKPAEGLEFLVQERGLRARLAVQSMLTGKQKIELGLFPDQPIVRKNRDGPLWEMPTIPSPFKQAATEIAQLPLQDIVTETHRAIKRVADILDPEVTGEIFQNLNDSMVRMEGLFERLESKIDPVTEQISGMIGAATESLLEMQQTLETINQHLDPDSATRSELMLLAEDLQQTSKSLRRLTDYLEVHPESLLWGKQ